MNDLEAIEVMSALAQDTRFRVYRLLLDAGEEGIAAGEIADRLDVPATTLSAHLSILSKANVVDSRRQSRKIIYIALPEAARRVADFLAVISENSSVQHISHRTAAE